MTKINIWDDAIGNRPATLALQNNYTATGAPGVGNDSTQGYEVGSVWINGTAIYQCTSAAVGAATWEAIASTSNFVAGAATQAQPAAPTAPASTTTYFMQGIAGTITPVRSGKVLLIISGTIISSAVTAGDGIDYQLSYGTGAAPANAVALAGTQVGAVQSYENPATVVAADVAIPFSIQAVVTGLTIGTAAWFDLAAKSIAVASIVGFENLSVTAVEL